MHIVISATLHVALLQWITLIMSEVIQNSVGSHEHFSSLLTGHV